LHSVQDSVKDGDQSHCEQESPNQVEDAGGTSGIRGGIAPRMQHYVAGANATALIGVGKDVGAPVAAREIGAEDQEEESGEPDAEEDGFGTLHGDDENLKPQRSPPGANLELWQPAWDTVLVSVIFGAELFMERGLFVKQNEEMERSPKEYGVQQHCTRVEERCLAEDDE
jgi:hypothetical protein